MRDRLRTSDGAGGKSSLLRLAKMTCTSVSQDIGGRDEIDR